MLIHEISQTTGLTKKAIIYYTEQGLVTPTILENGYRDYDEDAVTRLQKVFLLRKLSLSTEDIRQVLNTNTMDILATLAVKKELHLEQEQAKNALLQELCAGKNYAEIHDKLRVLEQRETITNKLLTAFPGYYGRFIALHFAPFLNEPIQTAKQQNAYETILAFLDDVPTLALPGEVQEYFEQGTAHLGTKEILAINESTRSSFEQPEQFLAEHKEVIEKYLALKQSDEYKNSPAGKLAAALQEFNSSSGYNDIFLPALKELSPSYAAYKEQMLAANEKFLERYPELGANEAT